MILTLASLMSGCGGGGTTGASLEVVNAFSLASGGYDGGLIITGENRSTGKKFSVALTGSTTTKLDLPNGDWVFRAVGWEGDADLSLKFSGNPLCGFAEANLNGSDVTVSLGLHTDKCKRDEFSGVAFRDAAGDFRDFDHVVTTRSFLKIPAGPASIPDPFVASDSPSGINPQLPDDLKSNVGSIQFVALSKDISASEWVEGFPSKCINIGSFGTAYPQGTTYTGKIFKLPTNNIPLGVVLFKKPNCDDRLTVYQFPNGFEKAAADGDHLLHVNTTKNRLLLSSSDSRRAYSSFLHILPYVKCGTNGAAAKCITMPSNLPDFIIGNSSNENIYIGNYSSCSPTPAIGGSGASYVSCTTNSDGGINVQLDASTATSTDLAILTVNSIAYNVGFRTGASDRKKFSALKDLISLVGPSQTNFKKTFLNAHDGDKDDGLRIAYGEKLGKIREHLSGGGALGLFGLVDASQSFLWNCQNLSGSRRITDIDHDGVKMTYRVDVAAPTLVADKYTCVSANPDATSCGAFAYDKKFLVYNETMNKHEMTITLDCDLPIGRFSSYEDEVENNRQHISQEMVAWNTDPVSNHQTQRFEFASRDQEFEKNGVGTFVKIRDHREMGRVTKTSMDDVQTAVFDFHSENDITFSTRNSVLEARQTLGINTPYACMSNRSQASSNLSLNDLFSGTYSSFLSTVGLLGAINSVDEFDFTSSWEGGTVDPTGTTPGNCDSFVFASPIPSTNSNDLIFKTLTQSSTELQTALPTLFSSNTYMNH